MSFIDKKDFEGIRARLDSSDKHRDSLVIKSREIVRMSKEFIYSIHRNDPKAKKLYEQIRAAMTELKKNSSPEMRCEGFYKIAAQEYVEATAYYYFIKDETLVSSKTLGIDDEYYLLGLCDLTGELVRKAINSVIEGEYTTAVKIKEFVAELYSELMLMNLRNGELRRKFDGIKYDLKKLEELVLQLKLTNKI